MDAHVWQITTNSIRSELPFQRATTRLQQHRRGSLLATDKEGSRAAAGDPFDEEAFSAHVAVGTVVYQVHHPFRVSLPHREFQLSGRIELGHRMRMQETQLRDEQVAQGRTLHLAITIEDASRTRYDFPIPQLINIGYRLFWNGFESLNLPQLAPGI